MKDITESDLETKVVFLIPVTAFVYTEQYFEKGE